MNAKDNKQLVMFRESRLRSMVKSIIYRLLSIIGTSVISWFITHDVKETVLITIVIQVFLVVLYYLNERVWNRIDWGKTV